MISCLGFTPDTVFRSEEGNEAEIRQCGEEIDGRVKLVVDACGIGEQADPLASQFPWHVCDELFESGDDVIHERGPILQHGCWCISWSMLAILWRIMLNPAL
jgi:hypothetical protein